MFFAWLDSMHTLWNKEVGYLVLYVAIMEYTMIKGLDITSYRELC
jgi:hypothetical protein